MEMVQKLTIIKKRMDNFPIFDHSSKQSNLSVININLKQASLKNLTNYLQLHKINEEN